jgi:hypothetical protein
MEGSLVWIVNADSSCPKTALGSCENQNVEGKVFLFEAVLILHRTVNMLVQSRERNVANRAKNRAKQHSALEMMRARAVFVMSSNPR